MMPKKSVTLIELILAICLIATVILGATTVELSFTKILNNNISLAILYQKTSYAMERMLKEIQASNAVAVPSVTSLQLTKKPPTGTESTSEYYLDAANQLCYRKDITQPANFEVILTNVKVFIVDGQPPAAIRGARITLQAEDPQKRADKFSYLQSLAFCRIPQSLGVVQLRNGLNGPVRGYYDLIQKAIDAASPGDEIRCMGKVSGTFDGVFKENIIITKSLTIKGSYDSTFTTQTFDPQNPNTGTPTTIDGQQKPQVISGYISGSGSSLTIDSFIVQNGKGILTVDEDGFYDYSQAGGGIAAVCDTGSSLSITHNRIIQNTTADMSYGGGIEASCYDSGSLFTIANNTIIGNTASFGGGGIRAVSRAGGSFTINNNTVTGNKAGWGNGIDAYCSDNGSLLTVVNNIITGNENVVPNSGSGGGIYAGCDDGGKLSITTNTVTMNIAPSGVGGGISASSAYNNALLEIINNTITGNTGGGVNVGTEFGGSLIVTRNTIGQNNTIRDGGGISASGSVTISNNAVVENSASGNGGGIYYFASGIIYKNTITGNSATGYGGGIYIEYPAANRNNQIGSNLITGNSANNGGGIYAKCYYDTNFGMFYFNNNIIAGNNRATNYGAGMFVEYSNTTSLTGIDINNNTITGNTITSGAVQGGGIYAKDVNGWVSGMVGIVNTICYDNSPDDISLYTNTSVAIIYSDIHRGYGSAVPNEGGHDNISQDPQFVDPANGDYHLQSTSPCIDRGDPGLTDNRPPGLNGPRSDMGAFGGPSATIVVGASP